MKETRGINDLDNPSTTILHGEIIKKKAFLRNIYIDFCNTFKQAVPGVTDGKTLVELGSGGGFIKEVIPNVITSDVIELPNIDKTFSALDMPFEDSSVNAFFMIDVLHHLKDIKGFFHEAERCLRPDGVIVMIEPANTPWGRFIYTYFHHETFDPSGWWGLQGDGPLSTANSAIPWIIFFRDRKIFEREFPSYEVVKISFHTPFRYLISGGVAMRQLLPSFTYGIVCFLETCLFPLSRYLGMFMTVVIRKKG